VRVVNSCRRPSTSNAGSIQIRHELVVIPVEEGDEVSGTVSVPASGASHTAVIIAHGAGNDMNHPLLRFVAEGLAGAGYLSLRFNFLYKEKGKAGPDRQDLLYAVWRSACRFLDEHPRYRPQEIIAAGKSLGGRIASQMAAEGRLPVARLVFLGYPLHPACKKEKLRDAHLYEVQIPMLFFAGTRDQLCDLELLKKVLLGLNDRWTLEVIEGGDHSFEVPKTYGTDQEEVYRHILKGMLLWLKDGIDVD
jgi:uncharacterized protein